MGFQDRNYYINNLPAVTNNLVAKLSEEVGEKAAIFVGRGDFQSIHFVSQVLMKERPDK